MHQQFLIYQFPANMFLLCVCVWLVCFCVCVCGDHMMLTCNIDTVDVSKVLCASPSAVDHYLESSNMGSLSLGPGWKEFTFSKIKYKLS